MTASVEEGPTRIAAPPKTDISKMPNDIQINDEQSATQSVEEFFANKNVFITGGTGFLGTVLIESILETSPNVGTIYVLVRDKYGSNANTRIQRMLSKPVSTLSGPGFLKKNNLHSFFFLFLDF